MSGWDAYIATLKTSSPAIKRAAIVGYPAGDVWARTDGGADTFGATTPELVKFVKHFDDLSAVPTTGIDLENVHYIVPRTEENLIFGKKGSNGVFAAKTKTAVLIAVFEGENSVSAEVRKAVENLADYLGQSGY